MSLLDADSLLAGGMTLAPISAKRAEGDARVDMTAMIDLVFMMNIFFLVTSLVAALAEIDLPAAKHVVAADLETSVVLTVMNNPDGGRPLVYVGDGAGGDPLPGLQQDSAIRTVVETQIREGKTAVVIKAEKDVPLREIARIASDAAGDDGVKIHLAVMEKDA